MTKGLILNCWLRSEEPRVFLVKVSKNDTVSHLQTAIKDEKPIALGNVDADKLKLYTPIDAVSRPYLDTLRNFVLADRGRLLDETDKLSTIFKKTPPRGQIHVIVDAPSSIQCWLRGSDLEDRFGIQIRLGDSPDLLISRIKAAQPELRNVPDHRIKLYRAPGSENEIRECLRREGDGKLLGRPLLSNFLDLPVLDPLRVVIDTIEAPARGEKRKRDEDGKVPSGLQNLIKTCTSGSPSTLAGSFQNFSGPSRIIGCNRPYERNTLPIELLHEAFGIFKERCKAPPSRQAIIFLNELATDACKFYGSEASRRSAINTVFQDYLDIHFHTEKLRHTECVTDGNLPVDVMPAAIRECRNESGYQENALHQAILYYGRYLAETLNEEPRYANSKTHFPCILMVDSGPSIDFYGAAWDGNRIRVEPLARGLNLDVHWKVPSVTRAIASSFDAFVAATKNIQAHYASIKAESRTDSTSLYDLDIQKARRYPFLTSYDDNGTETSFTYKQRFDEEKLIFLADVNWPGSGECVIKFADQYSEAAHRHLASYGFAPKLRKCIRMPGEWTAVIMDKSYQTLHGMGLSNDEQEKVKRKATTIVRTLHDAGFVHGDIRDLNFLVDHSSLRSDDVVVHLIDFDWAGAAGRVVYPVEINCLTVKRPREVEGGVPITKEHDIEMLSYL